VALDRALARDPDLPIASLHWGPNTVETPPEPFREFAHWLLDRGVDVVYGHSAHVFRGIEVYRGRPIRYDTGDFVDDYAVDPDLGNDRRFLFEVATSATGESVELRLRPTEVDGCSVAGPAATRPRGAATGCARSRPRSGRRSSATDRRSWSISAGERRVQRSTEDRTPRRPRSHVPQAVRPPDASVDFRRPAAPRRIERVARPERRLASQQMTTPPCFFVLLVVTPHGGSTMSARSNPFEELERLFDRMSRQFDDATRMWEEESPFGRSSSEMESMAIDLVEADDEYVVTADLPGFERDEVEIEVTDHVLHIEAEHEEATEEREADYLRQERRHQSVRRAVRLPDAVDKEAVEARMKNGVLTVTLPRLESEEVRTIEIE
jgi:HSP20 family protein